MRLKYKTGERWEEVETDRVVVKRDGRPVSAVLDHHGQIVVSTCDEADFGELMALMDEEQVGKAVTIEFGEQQRGDPR